MRRLARYSTSHNSGSINDEALTETYYVRNLRTLLVAAVSLRAAYGHPGERWAGPLSGVRLFVVRHYGESGLSLRQGENSVEIANFAISLEIQFCESMGLVDQAGLLLGSRHETNQGKTRLIHDGAAQETVLGGVLASQRLTRLRIISPIEAVFPAW